MSTLTQWEHEGRGYQDCGSGRQSPSVQKHLLVRYAVYFGLGYVPVIGGLLSIGNVLFVFRSDKRCVHDLVAKTMVVQC